MNLIISVFLFIYIAIGLIVNSFILVLQSQHDMAVTVILRLWQVALLCSCFTETISGSEQEGIL